MNVGIRCCGDVVVEDVSELLDIQAARRDIRGNEYKDKYYVNLNCWKILGGAGAGSDSSQAAPQSSGNEVEPSPDDLVNDDIPF